MSTQAPQVLSRRTNGAAPAAGSQTHESARRKPASEGGTTRSGRGKASGEKHGDVKNSANDPEASKPTKTKTPNEGEKLVIRRLPPGMTHSEFISILGSEWEPGNGKVDWLYYAHGKISHDLSKPSRPSRAYLHLTRKDHIMPLSEIVRAATWEDAKSTFTNPCLIGPPSLEFSAYKKVPGNKKRTDARQGTIDQDPEFMAFLEELANPIPLRESIDNDDTEEPAEAKITSTPLVEYLKEKRANKARESAAAKSAKHSKQEAGSKGKGSTKEDDGSKKKGKESKGSKSDKAASKETVKILTKKAATEQAAEGAKIAASQITNANANADKNGSEAPAPKSRRAGIAAAARILQRDLGLSPGSAHRRARQDAAKAEVDSKPTNNSKENKESTAAATETQTPAASNSEGTNSQTSGKAQSSTTNSVKGQASGRKTRGGKNADKGKTSEAMQNSTPTTPVILKKKGSSAGEAEVPKPAAEAPSTTQSSSTKTGKDTSNGSKGGSNKGSSSQKKASPVSANATRGFVKHANPSQGITEAVLKQALENFGTITFVEMDKRKGFAYVDFSEHSGLVKAVSASPISVAQGTIQVLERKDKKPAATTTASSSSGGNAAPASTSGSANSAAPEKNPGRGRRGRGGGGGGGGKTPNGTQAQAARAISTDGMSTGAAAPATTNGGG